MSQWCESLSVVQKRLYSKQLLKNKIVHFFFSPDDVDRLFTPAIRQREKQISKTVAFSKLISQLRPKFLPREFGCFGKFALYHL